MNLGDNKVIVLTGKLPLYPPTRDSEKTMTVGQVRYFSITHHTAMKGYMGTPYGSLMDDEITVNENNEYVIVYSREGQRPSNARSEYGITWQDWGGPANQTFVVRWMSVMPEWYLPKYSPAQYNIPLEKGCWSEPGYDKSLVGQNRPGVMGPYQPIIHYMTKEQFESLGKKRIKPSDVPEWSDSKSYSVPKKGQQADVQKKISELQEALGDFQQARSQGNRKEVAKAAKRIREIWDVLPEETHRAIENKSPGITRKIERIPQSR
jgi:hypothetical protein